MRSFYTLIGLTLIALHSYAVELQGQMTQGSLLRGIVPAGTQIALNDKPVAVAASGEFAFGFGRDADLSHTLTLRYSDGREEVRSLVLEKRSYDVQHIEGLPPKMVTPPEEVLARIREDNRVVGEARKTNTSAIDFMQSFIWPSEGRVSGIYGSQRVLNGQPKRPHFGIDLAAPVGTEVVAPADGVVTLWVPDMYYSGGTMIIDHGMGVSSTFLHLSGSEVQVGDKVKQGQHVAAMGKTGRATGSHLDWRVNWFSVRVDPELLVPPRR